MKQIMKTGWMGLLSAFIVASTLVTVSESAPPSLSTNPGNHVIFPAKGQTPEQQKQDELAAYEWASQQTGWDPYEAQEKLAQQGYSAEQAAAATKGSALKSAAGGALLGLAIGAVTGDEGEGAAIGAIAGGLTGGASSHRTKKAAGSSVDSAVAAYKQQFALWDRNFTAAMEGKGYTVK